MNAPRIAQDIMVSKLVTLAPQARVFDAIRLLVKHRIAGAPVVEPDQRYLGVFSETCCISVLMLLEQLAVETGNIPVRPVCARDFMVTNMITLDPHTDVFQAIGRLLTHELSGAAVVDGSNNVRGVFSEATSMRVLIDAAYDQLPTNEVAAFMNTDVRQTIPETATLPECAQRFQETPHRRLIVVRDGKLVGQVSRRDVLVNEPVICSILGNPDASLLERSDAIERSDGIPEAIHGRLPSTEVQDFMDANARTIGEDVGLLSMAQIFLQTPDRRLPVLRHGRLVGQVSPRDVLRATYRLIELAPQREKALLYLSSLMERSESPIE